MLPVLLLVLLAADLGPLARSAQGHVGAMAVDALELRPADRFPMQSVYKFPIAMAALRQVDSGQLKLDQPISVAKAELVPAA